MGAGGVGGGGGGVGGGGGGVGGGGGPAAYPHAAVPSSPKLPSVKYSGVPPNPYVPSVPRRGCVPGAPVARASIALPLVRGATAVRHAQASDGSCPWSLPSSKRSTAARNDSFLTRVPVVGSIVALSCPPPTPQRERYPGTRETTDAPADTPGLRAAVHSSRRTSRRVAAGEGGPVNVYGTEALCTCRVQLP